MRMRRDDNPTDADSQAGPADSDAMEFRAAIGRVRRLPDAPAPPSAPRPRAIVAMRDADERAALIESQRSDPTREAEAIGGAIAYRRNEVPSQTLRRLKRAEFAIEDEIDLHLLGERTAEDLLRRFLGEARDAAHHCVRIVHGKGLHSAHGPVLKSMVERVLLLRADVLAFASAPLAHGGTGALLVLLARRRPASSARNSR